MSKENQPGSNESIKLNDKNRNKLLGHAHSVILACLAGAVLIPAAGCADNKPSPLEAVIVDELGITDPGPDFLEKTETQLIQDGYRVDYIPPEEAYIDIYRELPAYDANMIIIRSHSAYGILDGNTVINNDVALFTSQPYKRIFFLDEQRRMEVFPSLLTNDPTQIAYFGIGPKFVENEMEGMFKKGTIVVVMGCNGLTNASLADAFFKKGVETYFGFDGEVSAQYTDDVTEILIQHLVADDMTPLNAVAATAQEIGPDPVYGGKLLVLQNAQ